MSRPITAATRPLALLGDPVHHSLSPTFQNAAIQALGLDAAYFALRVGAAELPIVLRAIATAGGAGNVTIPHKEVAARAVQRPSEAVVRTGVCNTFWFAEGEVHGDNTDVAGFRRAAESLLAGGLARRRVLVLGAGGAAAAVIFALTSAGAERIVVANRSSQRAESLASRFSDSGPIEIAQPDRLGSESFDLVVNATSLGLRPEDPLPLPLDVTRQFGAALDLAYAPERTRWINALRAAGTPAEDGLEMLLHQGAAAFERWFDIPAPIDAMRAALPPR